ncbi:MAG: hypothetical protein EXS55_00615 [Candidatus Magasanikbacteria bacterium]|nr:hypothetical protein [Candidatus Magasanikbacteria bacterium]
MSYESKLIEHENDDYVDSIIERALYRTHSSDTPEAVCAAISRVLRTIVSNMDEASLVKLKTANGYELTDKIIGELATGTIDYIITKKDLTVDAEKIRRRTNLVYAALKKYSDGVSYLLTNPIIRNALIDKRETRLDATQQFSLADAPVILNRLEIARNPMVHKRLFSGRSLVHDLLLKALRETDFSGINIQEMAKLFVEKLVGKTNQTDADATMFLTQMEAWLTVPKNMELLLSLKREAEEKFREGKLSDTR